MSLFPVKARRGVGTADSTAAAQHKCLSSIPSNALFFHYNTESMGEMFWKYLRSTPPHFEDMDPNMSPLQPIILREGDETHSVIARTIHFSMREVPVL